LAKQRLGFIFLFFTDRPDMKPLQKRYSDLNTYLRAEFGRRVQKIAIDAGMTCPNRDGLLSRDGCLYCNSRGSGTGAHMAGVSITDQLTRGKKHLGRRYKADMFIAYFQSFSNTYAPIETLRRMYDEALAVDGIKGLSIGTRPDCVDGPIIDLIAQYAKNHMIWMEYGLQTIHDKTLRFINRGHDFACFQAAVAATKNRGINICAHVILGLPGETRKEMLETADRIAEMGIDGVKLHLLYVVKGGGLDDLRLKNEYQCMGQNQYVRTVCDFLERLPPEMIIHRLTGEPHGDELAAPMWSLEKRETLAMIDGMLEKRDSWQGKTRGAVAPPGL